MDPGFKNTSSPETLMNGSKAGLRTKIPGARLLSFVIAFVAMPWIFGVIASTMCQATRTSSQSTIKQDLEKSPFHGTGVLSERSLHFCSSRTKKRWS